MDKRVIFSVAGSGKTSHLIQNLDLKRRFLLVTYTEENHKELCRRILSRFGFLPSNIRVFTYFSFLHRFCYQPFFLLQMRSTGINFDRPPESKRRFGVMEDAFFFDSHRRLYHSRLARFLLVRSAVDDVVRRIEKYVDVFCIDEVQDFAAYDFDFLIKICNANIEVLLVGDFFQHTFDTSRDGVKNSSLFSNMGDYKEYFHKAGLVIDEQTLSKSYRCSEDVCEFIRRNLGIDIFSHRDVKTSVVFVETSEHAEQLHRCSATVKLFYQSHDRYNCFSQNWGKSKGTDSFNDVCVVLNGTAEKCIRSGDIASLKPVTRNKLYVACSRARGDLYLVPESLLRPFKLGNQV